MTESLRALQLLRQRRIEEGRDLLFDLAERLPTVEPPSSFSCILERHYFPVLAFYHYRVEELDEAERLLDRAQKAVRDAITAQRFLLPFVDSCLDFGFQRVRIARNRRCWREMRLRTERVSAMMEDRENLCLLGDGSAVSLSTLRRFYGLLPLGETEQAWLADLLDPARCTAIFRQISLEIYCEICPAIPYP
ncbi:MAG TPA: hypothetical protein VGS07_21320 [Thermoanaerobaculia bacterium]|nr:hypothetical protein [Thermoanaerobaculia bacterium]